MNIYNDSPRTNRIHYKVNGKTFHYDLKGYESVNLPLLTDYSQIVGKYDRKILQMSNVTSDSTLSGYLKQTRMNVRHSAYVEGAVGVENSGPAPIPTEFGVRSNLSSSAQANYDGVENGDWFTVSREDYESVRDAADATQYIMEDEDLYGDSILEQFQPTFWITWNDSTYPIGSIPAGKRIIGYTYRTSGATGAFESTLHTAPAYRNAGTQFESVLSSTYSSPDQTYVLLKNPTAVTESTTYINHYLTNGMRLAIDNLMYPMSYSSNDMASWLNWWVSGILFQVIATDLPLSE